MDRADVKNEDEGLLEPSGLAFSIDGQSLWTAGDETKKIFRINLDGELEQDFKIAKEGIEGIAVNQAGDMLLAVKEETSEILVISVDEKAIVSKHALSDMPGFERIEQHFSEDGDNKGLEGITIDSSSDTVFVLKEGEPGLLIQISGDLTRVLGHKRLSAANGFTDDDTGEDELDFSGIDFDEKRSLFWIVSDKGRRLFAYDWDKDKVIQSAVLGYENDGKFKEIKKAEGVAVDPDSNLLFVISDSEERLYRFDIR